jgi:Fungal potassium channel
MLFTLIIWVFAALSLLIALLFYVFFLWHYIPNSDGGLSGYCERKINGRLTRIVSAKVNKALEDEERKKFKEARKAAKKGEAPMLGRQATIPTLFDAKSEDSLPEMPMLHRNDTMTTLPVYTSRPGTPSTQVPALPGSVYELSTLDQKRPYPQRSATELSAPSVASYNSNAPLLVGAEEMGFRRSASPAPSLPPLDTESFPYPQRSMTGSSNGNQWPRGTPQSSRQMTADSYSPGQRGPPMMQDIYTSSPTAYSESDRNSPRPQGNSIDSYGRPLPRTVNELNGRSTPGGAPLGRRSPFTEIGPSGHQSPAPGSEMGRPPIPSMQKGQGLPATRDSSSSNPGVRLQSNLNPGHSSNGSGSSSYIPYNPNMRSASAGISSPAPTFRPQPRQYRNLTEPAPARQPPSDYFGDAALPPRQGTPQSQRSAYNEQQYMAYQGPGNDVESQRGMPRSQSPANYGGWQAGQAQQDGYQR